MLNKQEGTLLGFGGIYRLWGLKGFKITLKHSDLLNLCIESIVYSMSKSRLVRDTHLLACEALKEGNSKVVIG